MGLGEKRSQLYGVALNGSQPPFQVHPFHKSSLLDSSSNRSQFHTSLLLCQLYPQLGRTLLLISWSAVGGLLKSYSVPRPSSNAIFSKKPFLIPNPFHSSLLPPISPCLIHSWPILFGANFIYTRHKILEGLSLYTCSNILEMRACHILETSESFSFLISNRERIIISTPWRWCKQQKRWKYILTLEIW